MVWKFGNVSDVDGGMKEGGMRDEGRWMVRLGFEVCGEGGGSGDS